MSKRKWNPGDIVRGYKPNDEETPPGTKWEVFERHPEKGVVQVWRLVDHSETLENGPPNFIEGETFTPSGGRAMREGDGRPITWVQHVSKALDDKSDRE